MWKRSICNCPQVNWRDRWMTTHVLLKLSWRWTPIQSITRNVRRPTPVWIPPSHRHPRRPLVVVRKYRRWIEASNRAKYLPSKQTSHLQWSTTIRRHCATMPRTITILLIHRRTIPILLFTPLITLVHRVSQTSIRRKNPCTTSLNRRNAFDWIMSIIISPWWTMNRMSRTRKWTSILHRRRPRTATSQRTIIPPIIPITTRRSLSIVNSIFSTAGMERLLSDTGQRISSIFSQRYLLFLFWLPLLLVLLLLFFVFVCRCVRVFAYLSLRFHSKKDKCKKRPANLYFIHLRPCLTEISVFSSIARLVSPLLGIE